jgi:hypothetical protein
MVTEVELVKSDRLDKWEEGRGGSQNCRVRIIIRASFSLRLRLHDASRMW